MNAFALLQRYASRLLELVFKEDATAYELFAIAAAWAVFWFLFLSAAGRVITSMTYGKPWLRAMTENEYKRMSKEDLDTIFPNKSKEEIIDGMMKDWGPNLTVMFQHVAGAMLCIPSLFQQGDPSWASSLAVLGLFSEMGFEIQDLLNIIYIRLFTKDGKTKLPNFSLVFGLVHHSLSTLLGIPMALRYRGLRSLHWLIFDLQFAGATAPLTEYAKTLDISKPNELKQFKAANFVFLVIMGWTRLVHFVPLIASVVIVWYRDKAWLFMALGSIPVLGFCLLNFFIVSFSWKRYMKFRKVSAEHESLPADASESKRRDSVASLNLAASLLTDAMGEHGAADFAALFLETRKVDRRQTLPARKMNRLSRNSLRLMRGMSVPAKVHEWKGD